MKILAVDTAGRTAGVAVMEDDRLLYYDAEKPAPAMPIGTRVRVESNDKMVCGIWEA